MAGVYVHIPFCKSRCRYCDFYSTTQLERRQEYVDAVLHEWNQLSGIQLNQHLINTSPIQPINVQTIYLGGGTPSMLEVEDIKRLIEAIATQDTTEITLEANPGDLNLNKLTDLRHIGINRLSIGIQSFDDTLLQLIGRRHNAEQAIKAVKEAQKAGFDNLSIDLMYGLPTQTMEQWKQSVSAALALHVQHISCYCLSYEEGTPLYTDLEQGKVEPISDETENEMYDYLCSTLTEAGYEHYEVSNFAMPSYYSRHNSNYWNNTTYFGLGAAAHSYDGIKRYWNPADIDLYIASVKADNLHREEEILTEEQRHIERVMLSLRTSRGLEEDSLSQRATTINNYISRGLLCRTNGRIVATQQGLHILNRIIEDLL